MILENELILLKQKLKENKMETNKSNNFISIYDCEEEYSHKQIRGMQDYFMKEAEKYLKGNYKGQYVIFRDWCVHIVTLDFYKEKGIKKGVLC